MTLQYRVWVRDNESLWWVDVRLVAVLALAKLLGVYTSEEPDEFAVNVADTRQLAVTNQLRVRRPV